MSGVKDRASILPAEQAGMDWRCQFAAVACSHVCVSLAGWIALSSHHHTEAGKSSNSRCSLPLSLPGQVPCMGVNFPNWVFMSTLHLQ